MHKMGGVHLCCGVSISGVDRFCGFPPRLVLVPHREDDPGYDLVADHTHTHKVKEPCTKIARRGPVPFYPSHSIEVSVFIYVSTVCVHNSEAPRVSTALHHT